MRLQHRHLEQDGQASFLFFLYAIEKAVILLNSQYTATQLLMAKTGLTPSYK
jgi:hypothetical protein